MFVAVQESDRNYDAEGDTDTSQAQLKRASAVHRWRAPLGAEGELSADHQGLKLSQSLDFEQNLQGEGGVGSNVEAAGGGELHPDHDAAHGGSQGTNQWQGLYAEKKNRDVVGEPEDVGDQETWNSGRSRDDVRRQIRGCSSLKPTHLEIQVTDLRLADFHCFCRSPVPGSRQTRRSQKVTRGEILEIFRCVCVYL